MPIKSFLVMIMKDFWEKKLVPLKLIFFLQTAASSILFSHLTLYKRDLGINSEETATIDATTCSIAIIVPLLAGLLADRIGNCKLLLSLFSVLGGAGALLLLLVPVGRSTTSQYPPNLVLMTKNCDSEALIFETYPNFFCDTVSNAKTMLLPYDCGYACGVCSQNDSYIKDILDSRSYKVIGKNVTYIATSEGLEAFYNSSRTFTKYSTNAVRQIYKDVLFFPTEKPSESVVIFPTRLQAIDEADEHRLNVTEGIFDADKVRSTASVEVVLRDEVVKFDNCDEGCMFFVPAKDVCSNVKELNPILTFWTYLGIRIFMSILDVSTITMFEGAVIAILREEKADYGLQKIYGVFAGMLASPLCGMLINYVNRDKGYLDFRPAFYLHAGLKILQGILMLTIDLDFKKPTPNITSAVMKVLKNVEVIALLIASVALGTVTGSIKSLTFGSQASRSLVEISMISSVIAGFIFLFMSGLIIDMIGHAKSILVGFILYTIVLTGYSLIDEPTLYPIFETLESATTSLSSVAVVTYAGKLSTWMTDGSIQGLLRSLYYGVGFGCGSLISGYIVKTLVYPFFALVTLLMSLVYCASNGFYRNTVKTKKKDIIEKEYEKSYKSIDKRINISQSA